MCMLQIVISMTIAIVRMIATLRNNNDEHEKHHKVMKHSKHIPGIVTGTQRPNDRMIGHATESRFDIGLSEEYALQQSGGCSSGFTRPCTGTPAAGRFEGLFSPFSPAKSD